jgi:hypothetical protein
MPPETASTPVSSDRSIRVAGFRERLRPVRQALANLFERHSDPQSFRFSSVRTPSFSTHSKASSNSGKFKGPLADSDAAQRNRDLRSWLIGLIALAAFFWILGDLAG